MMNEARPGMTTGKGAVKCCTRQLRVDRLREVPVDAGLGVRIQDGHQGALAAGPDRVARRWWLCRSRDLRLL